MTPEGLKAIYSNTNSWWEVAEAVNASIEVERERADACESQSNNRGRDVIRYGQEIQQLRAQLAAAQAAMNDALHYFNDECSGYEPSLSVFYRKLDNIFSDNDALDAAIAEAVEPVRKFWQDTYETCKATLDAERAATKPLVDALEQIADNQLNDDNCASVELAGKRCANIARAALTQVK